MRRTAGLRFVCVCVLATIARGAPEKDDVSALTARLDPTVDLERRRSAARGLYSVRKHIRRYPATVAVLIEKGLRDPDDIVRELSALTLSHSGSKACVAPLIKMAKRVATQLNAAAHRGLSPWMLEAEALPEAVLALGRLAATAKPALPMLEKQIRTGKPRARAAAAWAIYQISGDSGPAATVLAQLAQYGEIAPRDNGFPAREDAVRQFALNTLGPIGLSVATAAPSVRTLLDSGDTRTRACAVGALLRMGVADAQVVRTARELFRGTGTRRVRMVVRCMVGCIDQNLVLSKNLFRLPDARTDMLRALRDAGAAVTPVAWHVVALFKHKRTEQLAVEVIGGMGKDAKSYLPEIESLFDATNPEVQANAALAHWRIAGDANAIIPVMRDVLGKWEAKGNRGRVAALTTLDLLIEIGPRAAQLKARVAELANQESARLLRPHVYIALEALQRPR